MYYFYKHFPNTVSMGSTEGFVIYKYMGLGYVWNTLYKPLPGFKAELYLRIVHTIYPRTSSLYGFSSVFNVLTRMGLTNDILRKFLTAQLTLVATKLVISVKLFGVFSGVAKI